MKGAGKRRAQDRGSAGVGGEGIDEGSAGARADKEWSSARRWRRRTICLGPLPICEACSLGLDEPRSAVSRLLTLLLLSCPFMPSSPARPRAHSLSCSSPPPAPARPGGHSPRIAESPLSPLLRQAPRACAEELGYTFLPCVLANLSRAPRLLGTACTPSGPWEPPLCEWADDAFHVQTWTHVQLQRCLGGRNSSLGIHAPEDAPC